MEPLILIAGLLVAVLVAGFLVYRKQHQAHATSLEGHGQTQADIAQLRHDIRQASDVSATRRIAEDLQKRWDKDDRDKEDAARREKLKRR